MSLSNPRTIFGVHSITPYNRTTLLPYGEGRVLGGSTFKMEGDTIELKGGSNRFSWAVEDGDIDASLEFSMSEYPNWVFELFGGKAPTEGSAQPSGNVSAITDVYGTSVVSAAGIASVAAIPTTGPANLKAGKYIVKATAADAFDLYAYSDVDFGRGSAASFTNDTLLISSQTGLTSGQAINLTEFGLRITMGASSPAMTAGDTAEFTVNPINTYNMSVVLGGISDVFPEFGCVVYAQKSGSGAIFEIDVYKMKAIGLSFGAERKAFGASDYSGKAVYDSVKNGLLKIQMIG